ncbi:SPFH domain-containing protein [Phytomonospora sp. NPDC050363]|uniref:SPFH domain-containing protein n=1 Tax=Phytomonospora sp. NPDC050363 TaxID=3155642 RepID=UPI0033EEE72C
MERAAFRIPGLLATLAVIAVLVACGAMFVRHASDGDDGTLAALIAVAVLAVAVLVTGIVAVNPNEAVVVQLFGRYVGSVREPGLHWVLPLTNKNRVSLRVRNFETPPAKVNDADGNPVEIGAVIVWRVVDAAKATFAINLYQAYVSIQAEAAVRHMATCYPYDSHGSDLMSLRDGAAVAEELTNELRERVELAGVEILETRITHLAYAPEIAHAMLRRQQATAVVAARSKIVEGAVGMVRMALDRISAEDIVELDDERRAAMVSNLLVVLCSDQSTQPVVNTGSLYH